MRRVKRCSYEGLGCLANPPAGVCYFFIASFPDVQGGCMRCSGPFIWIMVIRPHVPQVVAVVLRNVEKSFGRLRVLNRLELEVGKGEYFVVLGPSGEGKSTLLNIIAGILRPDRGEVYLGGALVDDSGGVYVPPERRNVGYVFQSYALYPHMTAFDNIAFPLKMAKRPREEISRAVLE